MLVYVYAFPYFSALHSANEAPRVFLTEEIVEHHTFRLDARWGEVTQGSTFDVSTTPDGHHYSNKAPGASFLAIPAYLAVRLIAGGVPSEAWATWAFRFGASIVPSLLFLLAFFRVARRFAGDQDAPARGILVAYGLGSMALVYGILFYSHALAAACAGGAFAWAIDLVRDEPARRRWRALGVGLLAGASILADYQSALAAAAVGVYLLVRSPRRWQDSAWAILGALPPVVALFFYQKVCFGSPWKTGYSFAPDDAHKHGLLGIIGPNWLAFRQALFTIDNGLVVLMPWVLLAVVGGVAVAVNREARRRIGVEALVCAIVAVGYLLFLGSLVPEFGRAGWSVGPRYIAVAMPFFGWLAAVGLAVVDARPVLRTIAHASILVGVIIYVVAATTYPHWPISFTNPLYDVSMRLLGDGFAPRSLGTLLGLRGVLSLAPLFVVVAGLVLGLLGGRGRWLTTGIAVVLAVGIVWSYGRIDRHPTEDKYRFIVNEWEPR